MIPGQVHRRLLAAGRKLVVDLHVVRHVVVALRGLFALGLDRRRIAQVEGPERQVHVVAAEVGQRAAAEIPPVAPIEMEVRRVERPHRRRPDPQIVVDRRRRRALLDAHARPNAAAHPHVHARDRADLAGLDDLDDAAIVVAGVDLRAHLRDGLLLGRQVAHLAHFVHRMGQRLLAVHVQPAPQRPHDRNRVRVVGRGDDHGVEVLFLVEHLAKVDVGLGLGKPLGHLAQVQRIDVAQGDDIFADQVVDIVGALVGHADAAQVQFFVRAARRQRRLRTHQRCRPSAWPCRPRPLAARIRAVGDARTWSLDLRLVGCGVGGVNRGLSQFCAVLVAKWDCPLRVAETGSAHAPIVNGTPHRVNRQAPRRRTTGDGFNRFAR